MREKNKCESVLSLPFPPFFSSVDKKVFFFIFLVRERISNKNFESRGKHYLKIISSLNFSALFSHHHFSSFTLACLSPWSLDIFTRRSDVNPFISHPVRSLPFRAIFKLFFRLFRFFFLFILTLIFAFGFWSLLLFFMLRHEIS